MLNKQQQIIIIFGAPIASENDDERALRCALEIKQRLVDYYPALRQKIGINTGCEMSMCFNG